MKGRQLAGRGGGTSAVADHVLGVQTIGALCIMLYANSLICKLVNLLATTGSRRRGKTKKRKAGGLQKLGTIRLEGIRLEGMNC